MSSEKLDQIIKKQTEQKRNPNGKNDEAIAQLVGFKVGEEEFAVPILSIQEIVKPIEYTRIPFTPAYVLGVFNLRGTVIPLVSLRLKFGLSLSADTEETRVIVVRDGGEVIGFVIDKLTEAIRIKESDIDPAPEATVQTENLIYGVGKRDQDIITILNVPGLMGRDF